MLDVPVPLFPDLPDATPQAAATSRRLTRLELQAAAVEAARCLRLGLTDRSLEMSQLRAAIAILDRSGFGPQSTVMYEDVTASTDYTNYSREQLTDRLQRIMKAIQTQDFGLPSVPSPEAPSSERTH